MPAHNSHQLLSPGDPLDLTSGASPDDSNKHLIAKSEVFCRNNEDTPSNGLASPIAESKSALGRLLLSRSIASSTSSLNTLTLTLTNDSNDNSLFSNVQSQSPATISQQYHNTSLTNDYLHKTQFKPLTTSILKPGARFVGSQQSGRSTYEVEVELKYVDLSKSYMNGYLKIQGLTESHPEIITFFESEVVSDRYSFFTDDPTWGASNEIDIQHWSKFPNWKNKLPAKKIIKRSYIHKDYMKFENLYMRWKEKFLVPDHKIDNIEGASFAGFYYISFNQLTGNITGLYYHKSSEKFQQLELSFIPDNGVSGNYQFQ